MKTATVHTTKEEWLSFLQHDAFYSDKFVTVLIYEKEYPLSYISFFLKEKTYIITLDLTDPQLNTAAFFEQMVHTTFLGNQCTFLIKTPWQDLSSIQQKSLLKIIDSYQGPHYCIIPIQKSALSTIKNIAHIRIITVPDFLSVDQALTFAQQINKSPLMFQQLLKQIQQHGLKNIPFDIIISLSNYASVISNTTVDAFSKQMVPLLFTTKKSLYELSGQLFAKKSSFFQLWHDIAPTYSLAFWTTFWSDQLFKAALFCAYKKQGNVQEAQAIGTGLPFSFLNKDWRSYKPQGLVKGYTVLYEYDCRFKENVLIKSLDSWFIMFFQHLFD